MSNLPVEPSARPQALTEPALRTLRNRPTDGLSRRQLLRVSIGAGLGIWLAELAAGTVGFLWLALAGRGSKIRAGTLGELIAANPGLPIGDGFPAYVPAARAFAVLVDPRRQAFLPGNDPKGEGILNVRVLSQVCPHLGCRPNPCLEDFWFHCPCHQSRYDRLGIKAYGVAYGPAPRSMDRFQITVDEAGALTIDTSRLTLGPLPVALGQPGIESPKVPMGCS